MLIDEYIESVCKQIRTKKAHKLVKTELKNHIVEQKNSFQKQGMDEKTALEKAIVEMGDPISVGAELDRIHRPKPEWSVIFLTFTIVMVGLFLNKFILKDTTNLFAYTVIGTICLLIIYFVDYSIIGKYPKTLFLAFIILSLIISLQYNSMQYRDLFRHLAFLSVPLYAGVVYSLREKGYMAIILCNFLILLLAVLVNSYGSYMLPTICCMLILAVAIAKNFFDVNKKIVFMMYLFFALLVVFIIFSGSIENNYRLQRLQIFLNPYKDAIGAGYQSVMRREVIKNSQFIGAFKPFEFSTSQVSPQNVAGFLPEYNSSIIIYLISKFGFISAISIILIIMTLVIRLFVLSFKQKSSLGFIISFACTLVIALELIVYIINDLSFYLFATGGLPLISSGINLILNMCLIGILLSVFRNDSLVRDTTVKPSKLNKKIFNLILNRLNYLNDKYYS